MEFDDSGSCDTGLGLGMIQTPAVALTQAGHDQQNNNHKEVLFLKYDHLLPSLTLGRSENKLKSAAKKNPQASSSLSTLSSSICNSRGSSDHDEDEDGSPRKKLRLTKQQFATLEESFKEHNTLNPKQKQAFAEKLNLRPRQVEVWFQNRRARNKLKQSEVDCELLKRCCETLKEENKRLKDEVQELKSMKLPAPLYMQLPVATLSMCPSCERLGRASDGDGDGDVSTTSSFTFVSKPLYNSLTHPSAASC